MDNRHRFPASIRDRGLNRMWARIDPLMQRRYEQAVARQDRR